GRPVVTMRARDLGDACVVDVELEARENGAEPRAYSFADAQQASTFVTEAVEALVYLGCEIHASERARKPWIRRRGTKATSRSTMRSPARTSSRSLSSNGS